MIKTTLRDYAAVGRGHHPDSVTGIRRLSGFSNHLKILQYRENIIGKKPARKERKKREFHSPPLSFVVVTQSPSPQSYMDSSLILFAYAVALSKADFLLRMSLNRNASGDLARIRGLGGDGGGGDGVRGKTFVLGDLTEGVRGNDEYLFKLVSIPPFRFGSEGLSSVADSLMLEDDLFNGGGLASSKACRLPSDET
jgi:hypothetical protein